MKFRLLLGIGLIVIELTAYGSGQSLYSDLKARQVGDVVTILIVESANATRQSKIESEGATSLSADGKLNGNLTGFLPLFGMQSATNQSHKGSEGTEQQDKLTGKISARIIEISPNGMYKIAGERLVEVNGEANLMQVEGAVRARDINTDNTVYSYNLADAKIIYRKHETGLGKNLKPGAGQRALTWILGIGLVVAAIWGIGA